MTTIELGPQERILDAARALFFEHGVPAVTTDMLAQAAKTSKMTLYKYFSSKDDILKAVVAREVQKITPPLHTTYSSEKEFAGLVFTFLEQLANVVYDPKIIRFDQLMLSQVLSNREMTTEHYSRTCVVVTNQLTDIIQQAVTKCYVRTDFTAQFLSESLINTVFGSNHIRVLYGFNEGEIKDLRCHIINSMKLVLNVNVSLLT